MNENTVSITKMYYESEESYQTRLQEMIDSNQYPYKAKVEGGYLFFKLLDDLMTWEKQK